MIMNDDWRDFLPQADFLLNSGYPVTGDRAEIAKKLFKKSKNINSDVNRDAPTSIDSSN